MSVHSSVSSYQVIISSEDDITSSPNKNNFTVNIAEQLPFHLSEFYVRLIATEVVVGTAGTTLTDVLTIHANIGQQSITASNRRLSSNFSGIHQASVAHTNPYIRVSRPQLGQVNVQVRNLIDGNLAVPTGTNPVVGVIGKVGLAMELIPIDYLRSGNEIASYNPLSIA